MPKRDQPTAWGISVSTLLEGHELGSASRRRRRGRAGLAALFRRRERPGPGRERRPDDATDPAADNSSLVSAIGSTRRR